MIKRIFDILFSLIAILILLPFYILITLIVFTNMGWPILFIQDRTGYKGTIFKIYKFRTMIKEKESISTSDKKRITTIGKILRLSSLDELPELFNVLTGTMSIVGPRPLLPEYLPLYSSDQMKRHDVKPGITGWAQINGRNHITWNQKFELDLWYVKNNNMLLDIKIIIKTIYKVMLRTGIDANCSECMPKFTGERDE